MALSGEPVRLLAAVGLLSASARRRSLNVAYARLHLAERLDSLVAEQEQRESGAIAAAFDGSVKNGLTPALALSLHYYHGVLDDACGFLRTTLGADAEQVIALLPARHLEEARFKSAIAKICNGNRRASAERKLQKIADLVGRLDRLLVACDNRVAELEALFIETTRVAAAMRRDPGHEGAVHALWRVVRPDGSLAEGRQTVRLRLRREADLIEEAGGGKSRVATIRSMAWKCRRSADRAGRLHLVYEGCAPESAGGECHEPFSVRLSRIGILDSGTGLGREDAIERLRVLREADLPLAMKHTGGMMQDDGQRRAVAGALRRAMGPNAPVIVPLLNMLHAMSLARIVIRMGVRWGARIGETRQLRMGCFKFEQKDGSERCTASLRPKDWVEEVDFEIDLETMRQIGRVRDLAHMRWFGSEFDEFGSPAVPVVPFGDPRQPHAPDARYLLVGPRGLIHPTHLMQFLRVLLIGVATASAHDCRYLFATTLGLDSAPRSEIGAELHHAKDSTATGKYDLSAQIVASGGGAPGWSPLADLNCEGLND